ncbi:MULTISPECIES: hypothetical protein [unclassified Nocardioides]|uniref:hypothetical protein n=1 Tax=unclassified Nocardioides TaxID=2615069 RepID=UPI0006F8ABD1|nr:MULTISPECIES: hypothetical protein [unclassified Nocardioides]KRA28077.1 hypothetical protein ASD81_23210 [Nocardioides sp. Root614]KRA86052.1 hypothetical protein ASD84_23450 [Nocardioides sp. Root682]
MTTSPHFAGTDLLDEPVGRADSTLPDDDAREVARILGDGRLAYVAIGTARGPLVTPVLYGAASGALWVLTNRHALKAKVWRRRPRAGWTVVSGDTAVVFAGDVTLFSLQDARAILARPLGLAAVPPAVLSWACRNPRQVAGFAWDTIAHPTRGMPQDFVLVRLQPTSATIVRDAGDRHGVPAPAAPRIAAAIPDDLAGLAGLPTGVLGLATADGPVAFPVRWDPTRSVARIPGGLTPLAVADGSQACITFDEPVRLRPTEQRGIVLRGTVHAGVGADELILDASRATYWDGFDVTTVDIDD